MQDVFPTIIFGIEGDSEDFSGDVILKDLGFPVIKRNSAPWGEK